MHSKSFPEHYNLWKSLNKSWHKSLLSYHPFCNLLCNRVLPLLSQRRSGLRTIAICEGLTHLCDLNAVLLRQNMTKKVWNLHANTKLEKSERLASILAILRAFDEKKKDNIASNCHLSFVSSSIRRSYTCTKGRSLSDKTSFASPKLTSVVASKSFGWQQETKSLAFAKLVLLHQKGSDVPQFRGTHRNISVKYLFG